VKEPRSSPSGDIARRPVFEDPAELFSVIETAYQAAFVDARARTSLAGKTVTLGVHLQDMDRWFTVRIRNGEPAWVAGAPENPDVSVWYRTARIFHTQFWDSRAFMFDVLEGDVEFRGNMTAGHMLAALAEPFQHTYQELTRDDAPSRMGGRPPAGSGK